MTVAGVRGAITLAGILTLPLTLSDGTPFPGRDIAIFTAASVVVLSLVTASAVLPRLLKGLDVLGEEAHQDEEDKARLEAAKAAIIAIEKELHDLVRNKDNPDVYNDAASHVIAIYRRRLDAGIEAGTEQEVFRQVEKIERKLRLAGLRAERDVFFRLGRQRVIEDDMARKLVREVDLMETRYS
jgi:CPA1 family monovalent cation:H+ antiporter